MQETRRRILEALEAGPVSGTALAADFDVSRAAVWKHVEALREEGFEIPGTDEGYVLRVVPEFGGAAIEFGLSAPFEVEFHEAINSTNDRARDLAASGAGDVAVVADRQTAGRGRLDREWRSPSGGIWLSVLMRPSVPAARAPLFTLAAAVAVTRAVRAAGVDASIKWPNDVQVGDRKLAGVLTEMEGEADRIGWLIVGVGINANVDPADLPGDRPTTSLQAELDEPVDRRMVTERVLEELDDLRSDLESVVPAWREAAGTIGQRVRVDTPGGTVTGTAVDVREDGALLVDTGEEDPTVVTAGDCEHLRPAAD